jgi:RNAse (barnase) inhibitor barstar
VRLLISRSLRQQDVVESTNHLQALPGQVLVPDNQFRNLSAHWEVTKKDVSIMQATIVVKDGQRRLQTTRNPIDSLMGLQYGMIAEGCHHEDPSRSLERPATLCTYIGPDSAPSYRCPDHTIIVPVDGAHDLRFFCIPGAREEMRHFVLRQGACLQCALDICRASMVDFLIL